MREVTFRSSVIRDLLYDTISSLTMLLDLLKPQSQVLPEELKNQERVTVLRLGHLVQNGYRLVERVFCQMARAFGAVEDIAEVDSEVERQAEARGVCGIQSRKRYFVRDFVGLQGRGRIVLPRVCLCELC